MFSRWVTLLGRGGTRYFLGMIVQVEKGRYYLEDHTEQVPLNILSTMLLTDGFVTEGGIVLVEGGGDNRRDAACPPCGESD
ncbi:hypothetical protein ACHAWF_010641 [Thalassiosira exigua]